MENRILNEEIKKMMFLSNYNTSKTLNENNILLEQVVKTVVKDVKIAGSTVSKAEAEAIMNKIAKNPTRYPGLNTIDDVIKGVKAGSTEAVQVVLKTTKNARLLDTLATKLVADSKVMNKVVTNAKSQKKSVEGYLRQLGYSDDAINALKKADKSGLYFKQAGKVGAATKTSVTPKKRTRKPASKENTFGNWKKRMGAKWSGMSRTQKVLAIAGAGLGIYLLWNYFKSEEPGIFTDCVLGFMSDEDLALMAQKGFGDGIIITDVPNRQVAALGGVKLFTNGSLETVTGGVKGTWKDNGSNVSVTISNQTYEIPCASSEGTGGGESGGGGTSRYKVCNNFPYELYCKSEVIRKVQQCLGTKDDSLLGPATENALKANDYSLPLTKEMYDKIVEKCTGGQQTQVTTNPLDGEQSLETETGEVMASSSTPSPEETPET